MLCSIVIPVFNRLDMTTQCLEYLRPTIDPKTTEVIVVDNASTDGTARYLAGQGDLIQLLRNTENLGFARACNQGARVARGRYLLVLNNDTIPLPGWLEPLLELLEAREQVAIVGSKLLFQDDTVQHAGVYVSRYFRTPLQAYSGCPSAVPRVNHRRELSAVTGACMLIRRSVFETLEGFDGGYQNGFEDIDFCLRARNLGWRVVYEPRSVLYHLEGQTPGRRDSDQQNAIRFRHRWHHPCWVDEDLFYFEDGQRSLAGWRDKQPITVYGPFVGERDRDCWKRVADVQLVASVKTLREIQPLFEQVDEWPLEVSVLDWAADFCLVEREQDLARRFRQRADAQRVVRIPETGLVAQTLGVSLD